MKATGRAHQWIGKSKQFCTMCGMDKPKDATKAARKDCRPTRIF